MVSSGGVVKYRLEETEAEARALRDYVIAGRWAEPAYDVSSLWLAARVDLARTSHHGQVRHGGYRTTG